MKQEFYDIVVIGAGHAGCEAALAAARLGLRTLVMTLNLDAIALMPCNPSIGGTGKSQLVREVDALGGQMALVIDQATLQSRTLNTAKGPAVHSLRAQADKRRYQSLMKTVLFKQEGLDIMQDEAADILTDSYGVRGIVTATGQTINCAALVVASGTYLNSRVIIGEKDWRSGPQCLQPATLLSHSLLDLGFELRRFKTGTPARIDARSIDFDLLTLQPGDDPAEAFSFMTSRPPRNLMSCYLTWTNEHTHAIIRDNLHRSPMFSGSIKGTGARYCPSIEDKIHRFADKDRHQVFLEPEGADGIEWYAQGLSSSLPEDVQRPMYRTVRGLERCVLTRLAYAIEYDCIDPTELRPSMASRRIPGLFFAGQINGTSGYEEAAAQGLLAGINAARHVRGQDEVIITRDQAYIGVLSDDLSSKGVDEPYRMMTGRAEYRLSLRQDNADLRLSALGHQIGLADDARLERAQTKQHQTDEIIEQIEKDRLTLAQAQQANYLPEAVRQAEIVMKYKGYLQKEAAQIKETTALESLRIPGNIDYLSISALRVEARQKLNRQQPVSLGQAARIPGVTPADVAVLSVWLKKLREQTAG
ncbi:MAG TPA: tRNA uridine-5-carboxymethylaminomethyl(34) synthesis enzyme MnmG [Clostridia bacterium]|jgi:tRNA uridine 5-carboxymethylaminomethyl modification enzyme|nr:tRNA uridine-5-carboxymethylaminomethyl(34) synthesis enzyme MnmG [Clostridia bacterium]HQO56610.1 tRNA uridine-5-carboxymethylaminomethyl(34) synthesis enzyme MnmG [Clostridia bacterium]HUM61553.1 tRNA uridine-5-carboxymethylaminomethyl(34) synthesis enzyme MnmG [Clostridia bacterium]